MEKSKDDPPVSLSGTKENLLWVTAGLKVFFQLCENLWLHYEVWTAKLDKTGPEIQMK